MKKLAFVFAAVVAVSFASCGNKTAQAEETDTVAIEETETPHAPTAPLATAPVQVNVPRLPQQNNARTKKRS